MSGGRGRILTYESTGLQPEPLNTLVPDHKNYRETHYTQNWALFQMRRLHMIPMQCVLR